MKWIQIQLDLQTHAALKQAAARDIKPMYAYIEDLIRADLERKGFEIPAAPQLQAAK